MIQYSNSLAASNPTNSVSLRMRTREPGTILFLRKSSSSRLKISLKNYILDIEYYLGGESGRIQSDKWKPSFPDGEWHNVSIEFSEDLVTLTIDEFVYESHTRQWYTVAEAFHGSEEVYVGADIDDDFYFTGCLDDVRVAGVLLPFYPPSDVENPSQQQFYANSLVDVTFGCHGVPVCDHNGCANGATCVDIWNVYTCTCPPGFNGSLCQIEIDECESHPCENGATCVDGIANYTCYCLPGYTGWR